MYYCHHCWLLYIDIFYKYYSKKQSMHPCNGQLLCVLLLQLTYIFYLIWYFLNLISPVTTFISTLNNLTYIQDIWHMTQPIWDAWHKMKAVSIHLTKSQTASRHPTYINTELGYLTHNSWLSFRVSYYV